MYFNSDKACKFLLKQNYVYTLRAVHDKRRKPILVSDVTLKYHNQVFGSGTRFYVNQFEHGLSSGAYFVLEHYVKGSGFKNVSEWFDEVRNLGGSLEDAFRLYVVKLNDTTRKAAYCGHKDQRLRCVSWMHPQRRSSRH